MAVRMKRLQSHRRHPEGRRVCRLVLPVLLLLFAGEVRAHEGPPFPIVVDQRVDPYLVSVWTDPDIGIGTFFVVLEPAAGDALPADTAVEVCVTPVSGRLEEACYTAEPQPVRYGARFYAEVGFDQGEMWTVRAAVRSAEGGGVVTTEVEATPDGSIGPIGLVVYLLPFLAVGFLWLKAALRRRAQQAPAGA